MKKSLHIIFSLVVLSFFIKQCTAATISPVDGEATVSVTIGSQAVTQPGTQDNKRFSIFGNTSPGAKVIIQNPGIHGETYANNEGVFDFNYLFLSLFRE